MMHNLSYQSEEIIVFVKPACVQCNATFKALDNAELDYEIVDVSEHRDAYAFALLEQDYLQVPIVIVGKTGYPDEHWSGFRPDLIKGIRSTRSYAT